MTAPNPAGTHAPPRAAMFPNEAAAREAACNSGARWVGGRLRYFDSVDSTNARAKRLAATGWPEGTVVLAERQTHGRGRAGHTWHCPPRAGLLVSVVVPQPDHTKGADLTPAWLTAAGALAMIEATGWPGLLVKWPNDVVVPDTHAMNKRRKLGGVLVETASDTGICVLGIGLNVTVLPDEFPPEFREGAGSLLSVFGEAPDRAEVFARFLAELETRIEHPEALARELRERSFTLGREVEIPSAGEGRPALKGTAVDIDDAMRLVVRLPGGATVTV